MRRLKSLLIDLLTCRWRYLHRHFFVYRPTMLVLSRKAKMTISHRFYFNTQYDHRRIMANKMVGGLYLADGASLTVDSFTCYAGCRINVNKNAKLTLGSGYMNYNCVVDCFQSITIGKDVKISEGVVIRDSDSHTILREGYQPEAPIVIEDNVWIGLNSVILKGVTLGEGCVVAAGSVVTRNSPPHSLVGGVPARVIREHVQYQ